MTARRVQQHRTMFLDGICDGCYRGSNPDLDTTRKEDVGVLFELKFSNLISAITRR